MEIKNYKYEQTMQILKDIDAMLRQKYPDVSNEVIIAVASELLHASLERKMKTVVLILCTPLEHSPAG